MEIIAGPRALGRVLVFVFVAALLSLPAACAEGRSASSTITLSTTGPGQGCTYRHASGGEVLPDPACTPGAVDPHVNPSNLGATVCRRGYTATVRPPASYTENLKRQQMAAYGDRGSVRGYEEDHLVPLEVGGNPIDPHNLWPEPGASPNLKDQVESEANHAVCGGRMSLQHAQAGFESDWTVLGRELGVAGL